MSKWLRLTIFLFIIAFGKAHHMIRLVILAAMGLAGLWMLHTLAQDFDKIYNNIQHTQGSGSLTKFFAKRSINNSDYYVEDDLTETQGQLQIDWERILKRDPVGCARSFVCQLAAADPEHLPFAERNILYFIRASSQKESWASKQLEKALKYGQQATSAIECRSRYRFCPYSSKMMMSLLTLFGGT